jgi:hypothetical protein
MFIGRTSMGYAVLLMIFYQYKYNTATWEKGGGIGVAYLKPAVYPGDHRYPLPDQRTSKQQFYNRGFTERKVLRFEA